MPNRVMKGVVAALVALGVSACADKQPEPGAHSGTHGRVYFEQPKNGDTIKTIDLGEYRAPHDVRWVDPARVVVTSEANQALLLVNVNSGAIERVFRTEAGVSHMLALSTDRTRLCCSNMRDGSVTAFDFKTGQKIKDVKTGKSPEFYFGYPFPKIDPNDPKAATKIAWNVLYVIYSHLTSSRFHVNLAFLNRNAIDRVLKLQVFYNYWDAQRKKYIPANPNNYLQQYIAAAESPQDVYGTTNLTWRFKGEKRDLLWAYVPALRRVVQPPRQRHQPRRGHGARRQAEAHDGRPPQPHAGRRQPVHDCHRARRARGRHGDGGPAVPRQAA